MARFLSKSDFKIARTCPTKLYYKKLNYPSIKDDDEYLEMLADGGFMVEKIAKLLHADGQEMEYGENHEIATKLTLEALSKENATLFEATLINGQKLARVDILVKRGMRFQLIEVKAKSYSTSENEAAIAKGLPNLFWKNVDDPYIDSDWVEYLEDVAFQVSVLRGIFPHAEISPFLMMPDKSKTTGIDRLSSLFSVERIQKPGARFGQVNVSYAGDLGKLRADNFLTLVTVHHEVDHLLKSAISVSNGFVQSLNPELSKIVTRISLNCRSCEYRANETDARDGFGECWGPLATVKPHLFDLFHVGEVGGRRQPLANDLIEQEKVSLYDVPIERLVKTDGKVGENNKRQLIQIENTRSGKEWIGPKLAEILNGFQYPLHFIDFETSTLAIPYFAGMHPYEQVAFQWSCHTLESPNAKAEHFEWINVVDAFPNFEFCESLMKRIGTTGTVFMWATHENTVLGKISGQMQTRGYVNPRLQEWLNGIVKTKTGNPGRLVDMNKMTVKHYFHPLIKNRTSVKRVCDAIWKTNRNLHALFPEYLKVEGDEILSPYEALPPLEINGKPVVIAEGTGAIRAYEAMLYGAERGDEKLCGQWKDLLRQYCKLDTASMVMVWKHWLERTGI
jgi:hypothetical protein